MSARKDDHIPRKHEEEPGPVFDSEVAARIREDPSWLELAKSNLEWWRDQSGGKLSPGHREWEQVLHFLSPEQIADLLVSRTTLGARLRLSSPFIGILGA